MSESKGFRIEDLINATSAKADGEMPEHTAEQLMGRVRELQQGKTLMEEEVKELESVSKCLQKELEALQIKAFELEAICKEKEDTYKKLQIQCKESDQESARHLNLNKKSEERLEQYCFEIQEIKLKQRKQRMKFENQLNKLIELHRNLHSVFTLQRLPDEIKIAEDTKRQLLSAEQLKLEQLCYLDGELTKQKDIGTAAPEKE